MAPAEDEADDVDLTLRHVAQRFPEELARALLPEARRVERCAWGETQVTSRERRMDKSLFVVADGVPRVEHVEWQSRWTPELLFRVYEYHSLSTLALRDALAPGEQAPRIRSTVVLLSGPSDRRWPPYRAFRTTPRGERFSGLRVRVEPVYQYTVAELAARRSALWMVFAPLAIDATGDAMATVVRSLKRTLSRPRFDEVALAMTVLADADRRGRGLRSAIAAQLPEELVMRSWVYTQGLEAGIKKGHAEGVAEGISQGVAQGLRGALVQALAARGMRLSPTRRAQVEAETNPEVLQRWIARAVTVERVAQVFAERAAT